MIKLENSVDMNIVHSDTELNKLLLERSYDAGPNHNLRYL